MLDRQPEKIDPESLRIPDFGTGRLLTLGERKSLARKNDRKLISRILQDPDTSVIRILLNNPTVTESDVVRLCSRRPIAADVLREVFRNSRWIIRYRVKMAIALNPHTPIDLSLQIIPHLHSQDLRRIYRAHDLPKDLRQSCNRRIYDKKL